MKMKKRFLVLLSIMAVLTIVLAGCGNQKDNSVKKVQDKKTLVVGTSADYAPFEFPIMQNGKKQIVGFDILLAKQIGKDLGVKVKIVNTDYPDLLPELKNNKVDMVIAGMTPTAQRRKSIAFSTPYYYTSNTLLVRKADATKYNTIADLKQKSVGAQQSSTQETIAKQQLKDSNVVTESLVTGMTTELQNGKLDGVVMEKAISDNYVRKYPEKYAVAKVKLSTPKQASQICVAGRKGDKALMKRTNKVIKHLKKSGQLDKMFNQAEEIQVKYNK